MKRTRRGNPSKWLRYFVTHDPKVVLRKVKCPVLAINGELDKQVPPRVNLPAAEQALREGGRTHFTVKELPGLNHLFQTAKTGKIDEYAKNRRDHVADWLWKPSLSGSPATLRRLSSNKSHDLFHGSPSS